MSEREIMQYDVIIVGAGPAGLACAIRLKQIKPELNVAIIEKAAEVGAHIVSGAVIEPAPLDELLPGWRENPPPICVPVVKDELWYLTPTGRFRLPTPPQQNNHGNFIVSLGAMCAWLAPKAEAWVWIFSRDTQRLPCTTQTMGPWVESLLATWVLIAQAHPKTRSRKALKSMQRSR